MTGTSLPVEIGFRERLREEPVLVALSGGRDSVLLLHLLRFALRSGPDGITAAHLDHGMRPSSRDDALWCRGLCRGWRLPLIEERLESPPGNEDEARRARYDFLERARERCGAHWVLTAHHTSDQAETVLFRAARGTGVRGLRGILPRRGRLLRPLLEVQEADLDHYARAAALRWRDDPTNREFDYTRNRIRHQVVPELEAAVPGATGALGRLARNARRREAAFSAALDRLLEDLATREEGRRVLDREGLLDLPVSLRGEVLRRVARAEGLRLDSAGTRTVMQFTRSGSSGGAVHLADGFEFRRSFDRLFFVPRSPEPLKDRTLRITEPAGEGSGRARIGGRVYRIRWGPGLEAEGREDILRLAPARIEFPLEVRGRRRGDRLSDGRSVKETFQDRRVPREDRERLPFLVDAWSRVIWIPGVVTSASLADGREASHSPLHILIGRVHDEA